MMSDDAAVRATIAEDRVRELELERDKWKDAFNNAIKEAKQYRAAAQRVLQPRHSRAGFNDASNQGEAHALFTEEHLCTDCLHAHVCEVAAALDRRTELLPVLWRCAAYMSAAGVEQLPEDAIE
jgi:hypothetical protein